MRSFAFHVCGGEEHRTTPWDYVPDAATLKKMGPARRSIWKRIAERIREEKACPRFANHNDRALGMPDGYSAREDWWRRTLKTHAQHRCDGCGTYSIWRARK